MKKGTHCQNKFIIQKRNGIGKLTCGVVKEGMWYRVEAPLNGEHEIMRHRNTRKHVLEDQSLVLQLLPLRHCEWGSPIITIAQTHQSPSTTVVHVFRYFHSHSPMNNSTLSFNTQIKHSQSRNMRSHSDRALSEPFGFACCFFPCSTACVSCVLSQVIKDAPSYKGITHS